MAKLILGMVAFCILIAVASSIAFADDSEREISRKNSKEAEDVNLRKQLCSKCKIGLESYEIDKHSESCPYLSCWKNNKCGFYKPIDKDLK